MNCCFSLSLTTITRPLTRVGEEAVPKSRMVGKLSSGGVPDFVAVEIIGEKSKIINVDVNTLAVGDRGFRAEAVLAVTAPGRVACMEFAPPVDLAGVEIGRASCR